MEREEIGRTVIKVGLVSMRLIDGVGGERFRRSE